MNRTVIRSVASLVLSAAVVVGVAACDNEVKTQAKAPAAAAEPLPAGLMAAAAPADPKGVAEVRKAAADGEEVVVRGRIAGQEEPFTEGRAQFQLVDLGVKSCAEMEGETCQTPWDMCCENPKEVLANSVTVQVLNADRKPVKTGLKGVNGLKPLGEVSVKGTLRKSADGKVVTVDAKEMYVKQG